MRNGARKRRPSPLLWSVALLLLCGNTLVASGCPPGFLWGLLIACEYEMAQLPSQSSHMLEELEGRLELEPLKFERPALSTDAGTGSTAVAAVRWATVAEVAVGVAGELPAGDLTLWGEYDNASDESRAPSRASAMPRKLLFQLLLLDENGRKIEKFRSFLKFKKNGTIKRVKRRFPGFEVEAGQTVLARVKPKPATAVIDRPIQIAYDYDPDFGAETLAYAVRALTSGAFPLPPLTVPSTIPPGNSTVVAEIAMGGPFNLGAGTIVVSGRYWAADPTGTGVDKGAPRKVIVKLLHLGVDDEGKEKKLGQLRLPLEVDDTEIKKVEKAFAGFDLESGEKLQLVLKPRGGAIDPLDNILVDVALQEPVASPR